MMVMMIKEICGEPTDHKKTFLNTILLIMPMHNKYDIASCVSTKKHTLSTYDLRETGRP